MRIVFIGPLDRRILVVAVQGMCPPKAFLLIKALQAPLYVGLHLLDRLAPQLLYHFPSLLFANGLELLLLPWIQERREFGIDCAADLLQLLHFLQGTERRVFL